MTINMDKVHSDTIRDFLNALSPTALQSPTNCIACDHPIPADWHSVYCCSVCKGNFESVSAA